MFTCRALTAFFNWTHIFFKFLVKQINLAMIGIKMSMTLICIGDSLRRFVPAF